MKSKITFLICCLFISATYSQITFQKTYGGTGQEDGRAVQQTIDGGYIILGSTTSFGTGSWDVYLIKTNMYGDTVWTKTYGGSSFDIGLSMKQTNDGGYIISGISQSFGAGSNEAYVIKTDVNGDTLWARTYGDFG